MSVAALQEWRVAGCGRGCVGNYHDPSAHEQYGYVRALREMNSPGVRTGVLLVNVESGDVQVRGRTLAPLSPLERRTLVLLASRIGQAVQTRELLCTVWGEAYLDGSRPNLVRVNLNRLRDRLGDAAYLVETIRGHGYRLRQEVPA